MPGEPATPRAAARFLPSGRLVGKRDTPRSWWRRPTLVHAGSSSAARSRSSQCRRTTPGGAGPCRRTRRPAPSAHPGCSRGRPPPLWTASPGHTFSLWSVVAAGRQGRTSPHGPAAPERCRLGTSPGCGAPRGNPPGSWGPSQAGRPVSVADPAGSPRLLRPSTVQSPAGGDLAAGVAAHGRVSSFTRPPAGYRRHPVCGPCAAVRPGTGRAAHRGA